MPEILAENLSEKSIVGTDGSEIGRLYNVTPGSAPSGSDWQGKTDDLYSSGTTYAHTFEVAGEYEYYCEPHRSSGMVGSFTVE